MADKISEEEVLRFLSEIEEGIVTLHPVHEPQDIFAGNVGYEASNGWELVIFNDANEWDYIDFIKTSDGRTIDYNDLEHMLAVDKYSPSDEIAWLRYGIPGYCIFRCKRCGKELKRPKDNSFLCDKCKDD